MIVGIDPGLSGAIAFLTDDGAATVFDMPTFLYSSKGFVKRAVDLERLAQLLPVHRTCNVAIEQVNAFPGQGVGGVFSLGMSYWGAAGVVAGMGHALIRVLPQTWKAHFGLDRDKANSLLLARRLYPGAELNLAKHHGRAEAILIARYLQDKESLK